MMTLDTVRHLTVADYHKMAEVGIIAPDERVELIEGVIFAMAPIGAVHAWIVNRVNEILVESFRKAYTISVQNPIVLSDASEPQPDIAVLKRQTKNDLPQTPSAQEVYLVVEVSDSTLVHDRIVKVPLYARAGIPEVWIIDTTASLIEQYRSPQDGSYQSVNVWRKGDIIPTTLGVEIEAERILL